MASRASRSCSGFNAGAVGRSGALHRSTQIRPRPIEAAADLFEHVVKSPGPFFVDAEGGMLDGYAPPRLQPYLEVFGSVRIYAAIGKPDFSYAADWVEDNIGAIH